MYLIFTRGYLDTSGIVVEHFYHQFRPGGINQLSWILRIYKINELLSKSFLKLIFYY